jgi:hypothetical protein
MSEPEGCNDDCDNHNTTINTTEENFNDENDVDDETMSGKHKTTHMHTHHAYSNASDYHSFASIMETKSEVLLWLI